MSILILSGILASLRAKHAVWRDYQDSYDSSQEWGVRTRLTWEGLVPDVCMPLLFAGAWLFVLTS